jgi:hypothetical protein
MDSSYIYKYIVYVAGLSIISVATSCKKNKTQGRTGRTAVECQADKFLTRNNKSN